MTTMIVTDEQYGQVSKRAHELVLRVSKGAIDFDSAMAGLQLLIEGQAIIGTKPTLITYEDWPRAIISFERQCHFNFFGQEYDLEEFEKALKKYGQEKIRKWQKLGLEVHFLPPVSMERNVDFPGWKVKPGLWFYQSVVEDKIMRSRNGQPEADKTAFCLEGITVLVDTRLKPDYDDGRQMYENDNLLGAVIQKLRKKKKISDCQISSSRFTVSADEWESQVKPALAQELGLESSQVRLERAIEANVISQLYPYMLRKDDGKTNTWVWYEEYFEDRSNRLNGGVSGCGGLADSRWVDSDYQWIGGSFRPLAVL